MDNQTRYKVFNWLCEHANEKLTPAEWADNLGIHIIDDDGFREDNSYARPMDVVTFINKVCFSTIQPKHFR